ncbi:hypothetical protein MMC12_007087 [Toensbergia leucococca]|nr:hypothetical protein [Toensbergia leucococca]
MPLILRQPTETDLERMLTVQIIAFSRDPWNNIMFPGGLTLDARSKALEHGRQEMKDPTIAFMTVIDTDINEEIVAIAKWHTYKTERPENEWRTHKKKEWGKGVNVEAANEFFGTFHQKRSRVMKGNPHYCEYN